MGWISWLDKSRPRWLYGILKNINDPAMNVKSTVTYRCRNSAQKKIPRYCHCTLPVRCEGRRFHPNRKPLWQRPGAMTNVISVKVRGLRKENNLARPWYYSCVFSITLPSFGFILCLLLGIAVPSALRMELALNGRYLKAWHMNFAWRGVPETIGLLQRNWVQPAMHLIGHAEN